MSPRLIFFVQCLFILAAAAMLEVLLSLVAGL